MEEQGCHKKGGASQMLGVVYAANSNHKLILCTCFGRLKNQATKTQPNKQPPQTFVHVLVA
jgi:hypothetical protein